MFVVLDLFAGVLGLIVQSTIIKDYLVYNNTLYLINYQYLDSLVVSCIFIYQSKTHISPLLTRDSSSSVVRASGQITEGCGFKSHLELGIFLRVDVISTFSIPYNYFFPLLKSSVKKKEQGYLSQSQLMGNTDCLAKV